MLPPWGSSTFPSPAHTFVSAPRLHLGGLLFPERTPSGTPCSLDRYDLLTVLVANKHIQFGKSGTKLLL